VIARYWRGRVRSRDVEAYTAYVRRTGIAAHRATPGNIASTMLVKLEDDEAEVVVISVWDSLDAVRRFAGDSVERAVFYPEDQRYLIAADPVARHYDVPAFEVGPHHAGSVPG